MFLTAKCKICGGKTIIDIADLDREGINKALKEHEFGECPAGGFHVEIGKLADYLEVNYDNVFDTEEEAKSFNIA